MIHMHKRFAAPPSRKAICGIELAERNAPRFLTTANRHVSCPNCRRLLADECAAVLDRANEALETARRAHAPRSNRERFNSEVIALGLTVTETTSDGWHCSFERADGLHLWRIRGGIQTAWIIGGRYDEHRTYPDDDLCPVDGLRAAAQREPRSSGEIGPPGNSVENGLACANSLTGGQQFGE